MTSSSLQEGIRWGKYLILRRSVPVLVRIHHLLGFGVWICFNIFVNPGPGLIFLYQFSPSPIGPLCDGDCAQRGPVLSWALWKETWWKCWIQQGSFTHFWGDQCKCIVNLKDFPKKMSSLHHNSYSRSEWKFYGKKGFRPVTDPQREKELDDEQHLTTKTSVERWQAWQQAKAWIDFQTGITVYLIQELFVFPQIIRATLVALHCHAQMWQGD